MLLLPLLSRKRPIRMRINIQRIYAAALTMLLQILLALIVAGGAVIHRMVHRAHVDDLHDDGVARRNGSSTPEFAMVEGAGVCDFIAGGIIAVGALRTAGPLVRGDVSPPSAVIP